MAVTIDGTKGVTSSGSFYGQTTFTGTYTDGIVVDYTTGMGRISVGASDGLTIYNGGVASSALVTVDSSGNVGIGTNSPSAKLHVAGNITVNDGQQYCFGSNNYNGMSGSAASNVVQFYTNNNERARIDSSGNLLVGTTTTDYATQGIVLTAGSGRVQCTSNGTYSAIFRRNTSTGQLVYFNYAGSDVGTISTNGSSTAYNTSSDYRLKNTIAPMTGALARVAALKPVTYKWNADGSDGEGFIAHELQEVVPDCVTGEKDAVDAEGNPIYQGIDTSFLVATLTAAIQEQQAIIQQLQADVESLKNR